MACIRKSQELYSMLNEMGSKRIMFTPNEIEHEELIIKDSANSSLREKMARTAPTDNKIHYL
jgi:hypothetical protein